MGFFGEMREALRQGMEEGKAELAVEQAATQRQRQEVWEEHRAELEALPWTSAFAVALGGPYRDLLLRELATAKREQRPPVHLWTPAVPAQEAAAARRFLKRDFDAVDGAGAGIGAANLRAGLDAAEDPDFRALLTARASWLLTASAGLGLIDDAKALELVEPFADRARADHDGWAEYGAAFLRGERHAAGSNPIGRRGLAASVDELLGTPGSPWRELPWRGSAADP